tara:strand:+ start:394 stop:567 length:174 start_codon:yes stop_codon:yes gene_type:complete
MSMCGEIENTTQEIKRLRGVLDIPSLEGEDRKKVECEIAYQLKRLADLESIITKTYA